MQKVSCIFEEPKCCFNCPFISKPSVTFSLNEAFCFKQTAYCSIYPSSIGEVPWRDYEWFMKNKEEWCPLKPVPEED